MRVFLIGFLATMPIKSEMIAKKTAKRAVKMISISSFFLEHNGGCVTFTEMHHRP
jgi:hypothetical protein